MAEKTGRHNLYLSNRTWAELKHRAVLEHQTASGLIAFLLGHFIDNPTYALPLPRYQPRLDESSLETRQQRTVFIPESTWQEAQRQVGQRYSMSGLVELLLARYLGLEETGDEPAHNQVRERPSEEGLPESSPRYLKVGDTVFDLGEDPLTVDLKTGKVKGERKKKE